MDYTKEEPKAEDLKPAKPKPHSIPHNLLQLPLPACKLYLLVHE